MDNCSKTVSTFNRALLLGNITEVYVYKFAEQPEGTGFVLEQKNYKRLKRRAYSWFIMKASIMQMKHIKFLVLM